MTVNVGVLGYSQIAKMRIIPAILKHPDFELSKIGRREIVTNTDEPYQEFFVEGYDQVIEDESIDLIYIPLPNSLHFEYCKKAILAKKHVLIEKPITPDYSQTLELIELAKENHVLLLENFQFRFHKQFKVLKDHLTNGTIGDIRFVRISFCFPPFVDQDNIRYQKELKGGALMDAGCYPLKISGLLFENKQIEVEHASVDIPDGLEVDTTGCGTLRVVEDNIPIQFYFGFENYYQNKIEIHGSKGILENNRIFTAHPNVKTELFVTKEGTKERIEVGYDDHFYNSFELISSLISGGTAEEENKRTLSQALLLNEFVNKCL